MHGSSMLASRQFWIVLLAAMRTSSVWLAASDFTWELNPQNTNWNNALNWTGPVNQVPDDNTDSATVSLGALAPLLNSNRVIGALTIQGGGELSTSNGGSQFSLTVQESNFQDGVTNIDGDGSTLRVLDSPSAIDFDTDDLILTDLGALYVVGGALVQIDRTLRLDNGSLFGRGTVELNGSVNAVNDGGIRAGAISGSGDLRLQRGGTALLDMDGTSGLGGIAAGPDAALRIDIPMADPLYSGLMTIYANGEIQINDDWQLVTGASSVGRLDFGLANNPLPNATHTLSGTGVTLASVVNVFDGTAVLAAPTVVTSAATFTVHEGASVQFDAPTTFDDPNTIANQFNTTWIVNDTVEVGSGAGNFNWDGLGQNGIVDGRTVVNPSGQLNIDVAVLDEPGTPERVSARIEMNSGNIDIQNADGQWELTGTLEMQNTTGDVPTLSGEEVLVTGVVNVGGTGASRISGATIFGGASQTQVESGANLQVGSSAATSIIHGGSWTGGGAVDLDADLTTVTAATTVDMPTGTFDIDGNLGGDTVVLNAPLTLNVNSVDNNDASRIDDTLQINGNGSLDVRLTNPAQSYTVEGHLVLSALGGGFASLQLAGSPVVLSGTTDVSGNSQATARVDVAGTMNIAAGGMFAIRGGVESNPSVIRAGAVVVGPGDLVVSASGPGYLRLNDTAGVGADLFNHGHLEVGSSPGHAAVASFTQSGTGIYEVEIEGLTPSLEYDQLLVNGFANVDGTLEVLVNDNGGTYVDPAVAGTFDEFTLIVAADVNGKFDLFSYDGSPLTATFSTPSADRFHVGAGLFRVLDYDPAQVDLLNYRALAGDANGDGAVDGSDFNLWNSNKFTCGTDWTMGDFNGDGCTDGSDFNIWNANQFAEVDLGRAAIALTGSPGLAAVPEPFAEVWLLLSMVFLGGWRRTASTAAPAGSPTDPASRGPYIGGHSGVQRDMEETQREGNRHEHRGTPGCGCRGATRGCGNCRTGADCHIRARPFSARRQRRTYPLADVTMPLGRGPALARRAYCAGRRTRRAIR